MKQKMRANREYPTVMHMLRESGFDEQLLFVEEKKNGLQITRKQWKKDLLETAGKISQMQAKHIGIVCDLSYGCILCMFAVIAAGKVLVPLEADQNGQQLDKFVEKADIGLLLYPEDRIEGTVTGCEAVTIPEFLSRSGKALPQWPFWEPERNACIFFTSGTEGTPRGVVLTHKNLSFANSYNGYRKMDRNPRILLFLPIHHEFTFVALAVSIHDGCEIHLSESAKYLTREIIQVKPDVLTTVPMVNELFRSGISKGIADSGKEEKLRGLIRISNGLRKLGIDLRTPLFQKLREQLGCLPQLIITGGAAASEDTIRFFDDMGIVVLQAYGATETTSPIATNRLEANRIGSVGKPLWFNQVRIKDGEIQVRGENVMKAYYKDPQATAAAFDDGWLKTGDLGYLDEDGYLYITGRLKNLIILDSGENVSPEELEKQLMRSPWVSEAVVCQRSNRIHAQILGALQPDTTEAALKEAIGAAVNEINLQNPVYKRIASWKLRKEPFEKTSSQKIKR